jgi:hypothetical protein
MYDIAFDACLWTCICPMNLSYGAVWCHPIVCMHASMFCCSAVRLIVLCMCHNMWWPNMSALLLFAIADFLRVFLLAYDGLSCIVDCLSDDAWLCTNALFAMSTCSYKCYASIIVAKYLPEWCACPVCVTSMLCHDMQSIKIGKYDDVEFDLFLHRVQLTLLVLVVTDCFVLYVSA